MVQDVLDSLRRHQIDRDRIEIDLKGPVASGGFGDVRRAFLYPAGTALPRSPTSTPEVYVVAVKQFKFVGATDLKVAKNVSSSPRAS